MKVKLLKWQSEVIKDKHRFKVICAGRRAGKSVLSRMWILHEAIKSRGTYWIVSPTYKQSKQIHWRDFQNEVPQQWIAKKNEVDLSITLSNGSIIELKGAENPDALRGVRLRALVIDEIASIRNWDWLWQEVLRPTLTDYESPAMFISTPKGFNHFYQLFELGQKEGDYRSWRFPSTDNKLLPEGEIDVAKKELTEDTFAQEYLADFRKYTGLVYKDFQRETHVIDPFDIPDSWNVVCGWDFGSTNPTVCLWIAIDNDDNFFIVGEHYSTGETIDFHAGIVNAHPLRSRVSQSFGDPSGAQWISEFAQRGIYITPANKEVGTNFNTWVRYKIEKIAERLKEVPGHRVSIPGQNESKDKRPKLFVFSDCTNTIHEFETYRWKEKSVSQAQDLNEPDVPEKANDHALDALSYFAVSYQKQEKYVPLPSDNRDWRIGA